MKVKKFSNAVIALSTLFVLSVVVAQGESLMMKSKTDLTYWHTSIVYQVYPRSLMDSSADGIGDLQGIRAKVPYFKDIGVEIIWISPFFESPMADFGYDISNFTDVDPLFGTLQDFDDLVKDMHTAGLKVVLDLVPNHSSNKHDWFIRSSMGEEKYKDYYVWSDPNGYDDRGHPIPPNNWVSVFRFSSWTWSEQRKQFYYHAFLKEQPDLNYRNPEVVKEMDNVFRFWLDRGVDGFRVDAIHFLFEVPDVMGNDEPLLENSGITDPTQYNYLDHTLTINLPETYDVVRGFRKVMDEYPDKVMMIEDYNDDITITMKYYGNASHPLGDFPFNFELIKSLNSRTDVTGTNLKNIIDRWMDNMPEGRWPNWVLGNHDRPRIATRLGADMVDSLNMFNLLLPGTPVTYYGEEIGMENTEIPYEQGVDPEGCNLGPEGYKKRSRDFNRTPMQWDATKNAGFSTANSTWLPVNDNYVTVNVANELTKEESHLKVYKSLAKLRKNKILQEGLLKFAVVTESTLGFIRQVPGYPCYLILINTSSEPSTVDVIQGASTNLPEMTLPGSGTVEIRSSTDTRPETTPGSTLLLSSISLLGGEGLVLKV